jgi:hypothetical protein
VIRWPRAGSDTARGRKRPTINGMGEYYTWYGGAPLAGFDGKYCGGRHGTKFEAKSNLRFVKGPRENGRYPKAHAVCRYCGQRVHGAAPTFFPAEYEAAMGKTRTVQKRDADRSRKEGRTETRTGFPVVRTPAARKATAARKKSTVIDRHTPAKTGRHAKKAAGPALPKPTRKPTAGLAAKVSAAKASATARGRKR